MYNYFIYQIFIILVQQTSFKEKSNRLNKSLEEMKKLKDKYQIEEFLSLKSKFELTDDLYHGTETRIVEKFNCLICSKIVESPVKCGDCSKLYCENCIEGVIQKNINRCPYCMKSPFKKDKIDYFVKDLINESEFRCPLKCGKIIRYCEQDKHKKECPLVEFIYKCNLCKNEVAKNNKDFHQRKCASMNFRCALCDEALNILDYQDHLKVCEKQFEFSDLLKIYYTYKYEDAYKCEFNYLLSKYVKFSENIKNLGKINF